MKIRGRTITWQRVVGGLYLFFIWFVSAPYWIILVLISILAEVLNYVCSFLDYLVGLGIKLHEYSLTEYFHWPVVRDWVKRSVDKKREVDI